MGRFSVKNVIILVTIVALFIVLLVESSKLNGEIKTSEYVEYDSKYTGAVNQINYVSVTDYAVAQKYLSDFVSVVQSSREDAYKLIDNYYKSSKVPNIMAFNREMDKIESKAFLDANVVSYGIKYNEKKIKYYIVKDAANNIFVFKENGIMDYTVFLDSGTLDL